MAKRQSAFRGSPRHLALLADSIEKKDVSIWNSFLEQNGSNFRPSLAGADFSGFFMKDINLRRADLSDANFTDTSLMRIDFSNANLRGADFSNATLIEICLEEADLSRACLRKSSLVQIQTRKAIFKEADLRESLWNETDLSQADMDGADITESSLEETGESLTGETNPEQLFRKNWKEALADEEKMRIAREIREKEKERELSRKLGRRKPFFKKI